MISTIIAVYQSSPLTIRLLQDRSQLISIDLNKTFDHPFEPVSLPKAEQLSNLFNTTALAGTHVVIVMFILATYLYGGRARYVARESPPIT